MGGGYLEISKFGILVHALKPLCKEGSKVSIDEAVRIILEKYSKEWPDPYTDSNYKKLYYHGLNSSVTQYLENNVDSDKFKKFISKATDQQKEAILDYLKDHFELQPEPQINEVPYCCVNLMTALVNEAKYGQDSKQQKKSTVSGLSGNGEISLTIQDERGIFDKTFDQVKAVKLPSQSSGMRVFALLPVNGIYSHKQLIRLLRKNLARYIFSRKDRTGEDIDLEELSAEATTELRKFVRECDAQTLLGELLVYIFLEHCENAPKIFTKAEFFRSNHSISEKSIFIRKYGDGWQFIVGASNLGATFELAISDALKECEELKDRSEYGEGLYSTNVIQRSALDSSFEVEQVDQINSLILPNPDKPSQQIRIDSYGIFIGCQIDDVNDNPDELKTMLLRDAEKAEELINEFVSQHGLSKHPLYLYLLPFKNIEKESDLIIDQLVGR